MPIAQMESQVPSRVETGCWEGVEGGQMAQVLGCLEAPKQQFSFSAEHRKGGSKQAWFVAGRIEVKPMLEFLLWTFRTGSFPGVGPSWALQGVEYHPWSLLTTCQDPVQS